MGNLLPTRFNSFRQPENNKRKYFYFRFFVVYYMFRLPELLSACRF
ncbi:MAG: hypothetical protein J5680_05840 [Neisseriaceae bacterium]|nr:hypothetical protein [Neisseriaceae bacterium]